VKIKGKFFGTKKGKVLIGGKSCKVTSWTMNEIQILVPKGLSSGLKELKVTNKVGEATSGFTIE